MSSLSTEWALKLERELLASHSDAFDDMIRLLTRDKEMFRIPKYVVLMSNLISWKILYQPDLSYYNLPNITGHILSLVLAFCHYHTKKRPANHEKQTAAFIEVEKPMTKGPHLKKYVEKWDQNFINNISVIVGDEWIGGNLSYHLNSRPKWFRSLDGKIEKINPNAGFVYTGNPKVLKKICPGVYGTIKPVGFCMIGIK